MTITYAGTVIGQDYQEGGTDGIEGFNLSGDPKVQLAGYLRAAVASPLARGNLKIGLKGTISPQPFASSGLALMWTLQLPSVLPASGALTIAEGGYSTTFAAATLGHFDTTRDGCSATLNIEFIPGPPSAVVATTGGLVTDAGTPVVTDAGATIFENPAS